MFSRPERLKQRTPKDGVDRYEFLKQLVNEFRTSNNINAKEQVLANLANFAYDPINYGFLRSLKVIDLFLDQLSETNINFVQFATGGLCNLSLDPENQEYIIKTGGINAIINCLTSSDEQTVLSSITTLMFLLTPASKKEIYQENVLEHMKRFSASSDKRVKNLADIFLQDYRENN